MRFDGAISVTLFQYQFFIIMTEMQLTKQTRQQVVKSSLNRSTSKQLWSFPKKKRFRKIKPQCPHAAYLAKLDTFNEHYPKFSDVPRTVFQDREGFPSPADYKLRPTSTKNGPVFGQSREKCAFSTYIRHDQLLNPGPTDYNKYTSEQKSKEKRGFTMRPKTATHYNYFIEDKQRQQVPGPSEYNSSIETTGKLKLSKYRSTQLGGAGLMIRSQRFLHTHESPGPSSYEPKKVGLRSSSRCTMSKSARSSWIDKSLQKESSPGPGDYNLPSQFGHYLKPRSRRIVTIQ